jgi:hypothetical protein
MPPAITQRSEIACQRQRRGAATDKCNTLAILEHGRLWQKSTDIAFVVGRRTLETTDCDRFAFNALAAASWLARPVARAPENSREDIGLPVHHIGFGVTTLGYQSNISRDRRVRRTGKLAVHHFVKMIGRRQIGALHCVLLTVGHRWHELPRRPGGASLET